MAVCRAVALLAVSHLGAFGVDQVSSEPTCAAESAGQCQKPRVGAENLLMQLKHKELLKLKAAKPPPKEPEDGKEPDVVKVLMGAEDCCGSCGEDQFCSPVSGRCYDTHKKDYYYSCAAKTSCCDKCGGSGFCSPLSGNCYSWKKRDYYETCDDSSKAPEEPEGPEDPEGPEEPEGNEPQESASSCCTSCLKGAAAFCSPRSGNCYTTQKKGYYESCPEGGDLEPSMPVAASNVGSIKFMSYNLYGWNAFNVNRWRSDTILKKIKNWGPAVLGAQEVETGGSSGYSTVRDAVVGGTGLAEAGGSQFFEDSSLEKLANIDYIPLVRGYWMSFSKYKQKSTGVTFLFFNSHWKHGYGREQAEIVARKVAEMRKEHGALPTVLVGDTNQFCRAYEQDGIKYLKGERGDSPVTFVDAIEHDQGKSFSDNNNPDCRVDFILASKGDWQLVTSFIDREGMGASGSASDHAALMAELVPKASSKTQESLVSIKA